MSSTFVPRKVKTDSPRGSNDAPVHHITYDSAPLVSFVFLTRTPVFRSGNIELRTSSGPPPHVEQTVVHVLVYTRTYTSHTLSRLLRPHLRSSSGTRDTDDVVGRQRGKTLEITQSVRKQKNTQFTSVRTNDPQVRQEYETHGSN